MAETQLRLLPAPQPLVERLGVPFFRALPEKPGVYLMHDEQDRLVYVGKAKNLRTRLNSYRRTDGAARKTIRLVHSVRRIAWEICSSEGAALQRENELLRTHRPRFNRMGTWPRGWSIHLTANRDALCFRLRLESLAPAGRNRRVEGNDFFEIAQRPARNAAAEGAERFGAFRGGAPFAVQAMLQLLWLALHGAERTDALPRMLLGPPPREFSLTHREAAAWREPVSRFLHGSSDALVSELQGRLGEPATAFDRQFRDAAITMLQDFYLRGPFRHQALRERFARTETTLRPEEFDDLWALNCD